MTPIRIAGHVRPFLIPGRAMIPRPAPGPCILCRRPTVDGTYQDAYCESCGRPLHLWSCYLAHVVTPAERAAWDKACETGKGANALYLLCPGCRS